MEVTDASSTLLSCVLGDERRGEGGMPRQKQDRQ